MWERRIREPAIYILASEPNGTLYIGLTSALYDRMLAHLNGTFEGFTKKYGVTTLVYYEFLPTMPEAIGREKRLKKWNRAWKIRLIEQMNPTWSDLFDPEFGIREFGPGAQKATDRS